MKGDLEPYRDRLIAVKGDSTGAGDLPMECLMNHSNLPMDDDSAGVFGLRTKHEISTNFEATLSRPEGDEQRFSYPADHPLASEFEEQKTQLVRAYKGDGDYVSVSHPENDRTRGTTGRGAQD